MGRIEWAQIYHHLQIYYKLSLMIESSHKIWCYWNQTASGFLREWDTANSNRLSSFFPSKRARNWGAITTCYGDVVQSEHRARLKPFWMPAIRDLHDSKSNALLAQQRKATAGASALISASEKVPSGKHNYGKSPFLMGKSTIDCHFQ